MSEWKSIFEIWKKYSPYLRRDLMHREHLWDWAEKLGYTNLTSEKRVLNLFMDYLEEIKLFFPIHIAKRSSEFEKKRQRRRHIFHFQEPSEKELKETIKYYHPFQFFQFILYWEVYIKNFTKESSFNHFLKEGSININKKKDQEIKARLSDKLYLNLVNSNWLTPSYLKVWIKIDSLNLFEDYIISPSGIDIDPILSTKSLLNKKEREEILGKFYNWRENIMADKENFLTNNEKKTFKDLYSRIYQFYIHSSKNRVNGLEKWEDLIDMLPNQKLSELYGNLNISINILSILRNFTRVAWILFRVNLIPWPRNKESEKPYCFFSEESDLMDFRKSVLADFGLFVSSPFILYVEGETEKTIMDAYYQKKYTSFPIIVENIKGIDKTIKALTIDKPIKERNYFFFLDYERENIYKDKKSLIEENGAFFFPDFITENFEPDEILKEFISWCSEIGGTLKQKDEDVLIGRLNKCEKESQLLIDMDEKKGNPKGYEKVLINFSRKRFPNIIMNAYPEIIKKSGQKYQYPDPERFEQFFKKIFTENHIVSIIRNAIEKDPERKGEKFSFENKLKPFYKSIDRYRLRNYIDRYDLDI